MEPPPQPMAMATRTFSASNDLVVNRCRPLDAVPLIDGLDSGHNRAEAMVLQTSTQSAASLECELGARSLALIRGLLERR